MDIDFIFFTKRTFKKRQKNSRKFLFPTKCPSCGSDTIKEFNSITKKEDAVRRCSSEGYECEKISIEKIKHFVSKEAFNIEGLGKKVVENKTYVETQYLNEDQKISAVAKLFSGENSSARAINKKDNLDTRAHG